MPRIHRTKPKGRKARDIYDDFDVYAKEPESWDQWRSRNKPVHGCGHMQGRGAA